MKILVLCAWLILECTQILTWTTEPLNYIEEDFKPYYEEFLVVGQVKAPEYITMRFKALESPRVGECILGLPYTRAINIDPYYWNNSSVWQRKEVIWHELGHCVLLRVHRTDLLSNGWPASIMFPSQFDPRIIFDENYEYYKKELFGK